MSTTSYVPNEKTRQAFERCREQNRPAFIPFVMAGYPNYDDSIRIALTLQEAGADLMEIGFPYSDPLADGPTIQKASERALAEGMQFRKGLELISDMRQAGVHIPLFIFSYYNPVLQYGFEGFVQKAIEIGANGVLIPDVPHEEAAAMREISARYQFDFIRFVAPTSRERTQHVVQGASGFLYCISSLGVTGARHQFAEGIESFLTDVRKHTSVPLAVGFGVSRKEHIQQLSGYADGIIIASALINIIDTYVDTDSTIPEEGLAQLKTFVDELFSE